MEKRYGILILGTFACAACFLLSACAEPAAEQSSVHPPYDGQIQDADVFIDMPNLRQYGGYTCGTTCVQMVMNWIQQQQQQQQNSALFGNSALFSMGGDAEAGEEEEEY